MTNTFLILLPIALFLVMLMGLSLWAERAGRRNRFAGEYFLGDRSLKGFVLAMTLVATYGSVSSFVSGPGLAWQLGLGWVVFAAPQIIAGFLILGVAGKKMAVVSRAAGALTVIDMIRARYGDGRGGRTLAALLAVLMLVFFTTMMIGQFIGGAQIFSKAAGVSYGWGLVLFGAVTVLYTAFGGFRAVAVTDTACAVLMLVGMGALGLPQSAVRCMSYRRSSDLHQAMIVSTVVCGALMIGMTVMGVFARGMLDVPLSEMGGTTDAVMPYLIANYMDPVTAGVTLIGPLAATMSTVSSLLLAAASAIMKDLVLFHRPEAGRNEARLRMTTRLMTGALGLLALILALEPLDVIAWINLFAFGGLELAFLMPLIGGLFWRGATAGGALVSVAGSIAFYLAVTIFKIPMGGAHAIAPCMVVAAVLFVAGSRLTPASPVKAIDLFFPRR